MYHMKTRQSLLVILVLVSAACFAQTAAPGRRGCKLEGTWYGGSPDVSSPYYQGAITPNGADRFSSVFQYYGEQQSFGYLHWTDWKGEISKKTGQTYTGSLFSMWQWDPASPLLPPGVDASLPELDFIHADHLEFIDCDTFRITYDVWFVYFNFTYEIKPLEPPPPPGYILILDPPLVEVYHRTPVAQSYSLPNQSNVNPGTHVGRGPLPPKAVPK